MTKQINGDKLFVIDPHPAIPPSDQLKKWEDKWFDEEEHPDVLLIQAFQAGADQELEACCEYLVRCAQWEPEDVDELRAARRPKQLSLKEEALTAPAHWSNSMTDQHRATPEQWESIERYADSISYSCILELRARIEALEAAQQPSPKPPSWRV